MRIALESLADTRPLVVVIEDIHWAEPTLIDLIVHLARSVREGVLLVCSARSELLDEHPGWTEGLPSVWLIRLEPLTQGESSHLIDNILGGAGLVPAVRRSITDASGGNPLFVEETLSMLRDRGLFATDTGGWEMEGGEVSSIVPDGHRRPAGSSDRSARGGGADPHRPGFHHGRRFAEDALRALYAGGSAPASRCL